MYIYIYEYYINIKSSDFIVILIVLKIGHLFIQYQQRVWIKQSPIFWKGVFSTTLYPHYRRLLLKVGPVGKGHQQAVCLEGARQDLLVSHYSDKCH